MCHYNLTLQLCFIQQKENSQPVSYPSLLSHISSLYLNHPVIPMAVNKDFGAASLVSEFRPLASSMPCDLHVVNLRAIQSKVCFIFYYVCLFGT